VSNGSGPGWEPAIADGLQEPRVAIRAAGLADVPAVVAGIVELLLEIGGKPAARDRLEAVARELIDDPDAGAVLVAECEGRIVGVLGVSWQSAIRAAGRYGLIQELWVKREYRYREIGADLLDALVRVARERGVQRLEVGLPSERYPHLVATESFYETNDFTGVGLRMRRLL
jgi:GNAT superfamily N-acetyltransferase